MQKAEARAVLKTLQAIVFNRSDEEVEKVIDELRAQIDGMSVKPDRKKRGGHDRQESGGHDRGAS